MKYPRSKSRLSELAGIVEAKAVKIPWPWLDDPNADPIADLKKIGTKARKSGNQYLMITSPSGTAAKQKLKDWLIHNIADDDLAYANELGDDLDLPWT